jgi:hypothetical protein
VWSVSSVAECPRVEQSHVPALHLYPPKPSECSQAFDHGFSRQASPGPEFALAHGKHHLEYTIPGHAVSLTEVEK